jgi:hypothetical protein
MRRLVFTVVLCLAVLALVPVSANGLNAVSYFETPSGKIVCALVSPTPGFGSDSVGCEVTIGLKRPIPKSGPSCRRTKYVGSEFGLGGKGPAIVTPCADSHIFAHPYSISVLSYGQTLKGGGIACSEATTGLTCRNRSGHGFFLSPAHWHTF